MPMEIRIEEDCGNAPKKEFVKNFTIALAQGEVEKVAEMVTDDVVWEVVGEAEFQGKGQMDEAMKAWSLNHINFLEVENILSHGNICAAHGLLKSPTESVRFADFYRFNSHAKDAKIKKIVSYGVKV